MKEFEIAKRIVVESCALIPDLEFTRDRVHLSRQCTCLRATLRGVPARRIDILVDEAILSGEPFGGDVSTTNGAFRIPRVIVAEMGLKSGRFDEAIRNRLTFRLMNCATVERDAIPSGSVSVARESGVLHVFCTASDGWAGSFESEILRSDLESYDYRRLIAWHWTRYFRFLVWDDELEAFATGWAPKKAVTLAEANRQASCALYRRARDAGWRKLTLRERRKFELEAAAQWQHQDVLAALPESAELIRQNDWDRDPGHPTGCGEYTLRAARVGIDHEIAGYSDDCEVIRYRPEEAE